MPPWKSPPGAGRPKTGHQSIRGKISGPIPIPSPMDEEFPTRKPGAGIASPTPLESKEVDQQRQPQPPQAAGIPVAAGVSGSRTDVPQASQPEPTSVVPPAPPAGPGPADASGSGGPAPQSSPPRHRTNPSGTLRYSTVSASTNNTSQAGARPERKKSALRGALSKLFGRKKKGSQGSVSTTGRMSTLTATPHRSDMSALNRTNQLEQKRSASLPITEFDRALRSHSIGPEDITAIESARNSLQADPSPNRRRAATMTSRTFLGPRRGEFGEWAGLSPRPASSQGRGSRLGGLADDPDQIGRAITSDGGGELSHRRRSRSLSQLHDVMDGRSETRRRSDEIRYWRESYDPGFLSPLSSAAPETENEPVEGNGDAGQAPVSLPESPTLDRPPKTPPQPFTFGSVASMNEMAGMKITQAAGIDVRIRDLETQMQTMTRVVNQLCHSLPGFKGPLSEFGERAAVASSQGAAEPPLAFTSAVPPKIPAIYQSQAVSQDLNASSSRYSSSRHSTDTDAHSHMSFGEGQTYIGSLHPPSSSTQVHTIPATSHPAPLISPADRPMSTSTIRGAASMPSLEAGRDHGDEQQAAALLAQLEAERAARQALEAQVKKLSQRLNTLSTTMFAMVRDPSKSRSRERLAPTATSPTTTTAAAAVTVTAPAATVATPAVLSPVSITVPPPPSSSAQSMFEEDDDSSPTKEDYQEEDFQTPAEEPRSYGAFGEELREEQDSDDDPKRKKAARTLSLSQLTYGRGVSARV
ncbi:hypothetical protein NKR23_g7493 [Pleurostoma richardsiae]|uniref:Uncharacterized protein n=1 Tax=Pleurostoma richardsiae TaxID=41990 RepID=A0AA38RN57_9PEZI|nr:hypothetical protein NKR23_g7493 [Pleurostoma richardsiae]